MGKTPLYEGKAKRLFKTDNPDELLQYFKDDATAFNGAKKGEITSKGVINNAISSHLFKFIESNGIPTHFVNRLSDREMLIKKVEIIPVEVVVRNITAGSLSKRMGVKDGMKLKETIIEFYYKDDALGDPMINQSHIRAFDLASDKEMDTCVTYALKINSMLVDFFDRINLTLVDYKLEFGRHKGEIILADEISPDGCRLWDKKSGERMDKDRFRQDLGNIEAAYQEVCNRVLGVINEN